LRSQMTENANGKISSAKANELAQEGTGKN
jgi:hypothetical protein